MLSIGDRMVAPRLLILDKDGTLIAFDLLWRTWYGALVAAIEVETPLGPRARRALDATLGVAQLTGAWDSAGPLVLASTGEVGILLAGVLYRYAHQPWPEALQRVERAERNARDALRGQNLIQPIGDVAGLLRRLRAAGLLLALATTDSRASAEECLAQLGITACFDATVCGDDGVPLKPAPDMVLKLCAELGVPPAQTVVVGDTVLDMEMARAAGCLCAVGVTSGALSAEHLAPYADVVLPDIHGLHIVAPGEWA